MEEELKALAERVDFLEKKIQANSKSINLLTEITGKLVDVGEEVFAILKGMH